MNRNNFIYFIMLVWVLASCGVNSTYESISTIENNSWNTDSIVTFNFEVEEAGVYNVYYLVKNKTTYPYYNLYFKVDFRDEKTLISDKLQEVLLFNKKTGEPYGKGLGGVMEHEFLAFTKQKLRKGKHTLSMRHYMRIDELRDVLAVGVKVVKEKE